MVAVQLCEVCGIPSTNTCGKCKTTFYCSVNHQKLFWKYHKLVCGLENNNFTIVPMADIQPSEVLDFIEVIIEGKLRANKPVDQVLYIAKNDVRWQESILEVYNQTFAQSDQKTRILEISQVRNNIEFMTSTKGTETRGSTDVQPFYALSCLELLINGTKVPYQYIYVKNAFSFLCLQQTFKSTAKNTPQLKIISDLFVKSMDRLEKTLEDLENKGLDKYAVSIYRNWNEHLAGQMKAALRDK